MNVKKFVKHWSSHGYEKGEAQPFWLSFLRDVFDIAEPQDKISVERELSIKASAIVAKIYDGLRAEIKIQSNENLSDLNKLCVRLVFCLYSESIDIFGKHKIFRDYLRGARNIRQDLIELFKVLDTPIASSQLIIIPSATVYHFGILTSSIHMAWMRAVAGRLKSDYRYSGSVVYNNKSERVQRLQGVGSGRLRLQFALQCRQ